MSVVGALPTASRDKKVFVDWPAAKALMIENPGEWVLCAENISASTPRQIQIGKNASFQGDDLTHFEFKTRRPKEPKEPYDERRTDVYGKYTPPKSKRVTGA